MKYLILICACITAVLWKASPPMIVGRKTTAWGILEFTHKHRRKVDVKSLSMHLHCASGKDINCSNSIVV